ncbi:MBL fold metallo-hydrolase [Chitinophaga defluvii]|uniref:MBL fold metallo-hydrolase n=1 Tax=Chitinophaga defluvii TaxID=3163343 RepID=A0ABV2TAE5_9BACT
MKIQRLGWAGIKIETGGLTILVDAVEHYAASRFFVIDTKDADYTFSDDTQADYAVITHLHTDHYDAGLIRKCLKPEGKLVCSSLFSDQLRADGFDNLVVLSWEEVFDAGAVQFTPVFAMDGFGDQQVSWVIEDSTHRILHGGDTIWHNQFWKIGAQYQGFDAVFLPVNGVLMHFKKPESGGPATLTPEQAIGAAVILGAKVLIPIHYGFNLPGVYEEYPNVVPRLKEIAAGRGLPLSFLQPGAYLEPQATLQEANN